MRYLLLFFLAILYACQTSQNTEKTTDFFKHIHDPKVKEIIQKAIAHAGGMEAWQSIEELSYTKDFSLLLESGEVEKEYKQKHHYQYHPLKIDIQSMEDGQLVHTKLEKGQYSRIIDGQAIDVSEEALSKAINSSTYVIGIPFKLLDAGAEIDFEGQSSLPDGQMANILSVSYNAEKHANHSSTDIWKYYFHPKTGAVLANWVQTGDHANIIENLDFERAGGVLFHKHRKSYRLDSLGNKDYLRAEYFYGNYDVK